LAADLQKKLDRRTRELAKARKLLKDTVQQQNATSEVLQVINSFPAELAPVFDAMLKRAMQLCEAAFGGLWIFEGERYVAEALFGVPPAYASYLRQTNSVPGPHTAPYRFLKGERLAIQNVDLAAEEAYVTGDPQRRALVDLGGARTALQVPLVRNDVVLGVITVYRQQAKPFSEQHAALLQNFAAQAVIAIENTRLFNEVQAKTRDLEESLQQQTATADVLKVISRSAFDLDTVMNTLARSARDLCGSKTAALFLRDGDMLVGRGAAAGEPVDNEFLKANPVPLNDESHMGRALLTGTIANIGDFENDPGTKLRKFQRIMGFKSFLAVPLMREGRGVGVFSLTRDELGQFSQRQVELVQTFADQAVIAIENTRLFNEVQAKTRDLEEALVYQTGSSDILSVIASSPTDVGPALTAIVESACEICNAYDASVLLKDGEDLVVSAHHGPIPAGFTKNRISRKWVTGRAVVDKAPQHVHDLPGPEGDDFSQGRDLARQHGYHTVLAVPLLREDEAIGAIVVRRMEVQPFNDKQVELLKSFADQAVIAISNVRLFEQVQERTRELSRSLDDLRTAQDRLIQTEKLASLGQLTAGIAHEIKNPLNFVNNFSALSVELTDELNDVLKRATLADKIRAEASELTGLLKDNLDKVVQHGKRADSIVKNMLLHSREGSGERRSADVNALVGESLNLAYHGARAEKAGFSITLRHDLDPEAGAVDLYPQEITRALLNLISNGFYAATRRKVETGGETFEPTLSAATRNLGKTVEIRIRDNGTGIPPEVRAKMFNPFFTTKPTGEGTGLGLSLTHDIIVKQHGGSIDVETRPGEFTEFIITLPRGNVTAVGEKAG
jgi:signal transduction histidine kinase